MKVANFEKVSESQFCSDAALAFPDAHAEDLSSAWGELLLPRRATAGSAGYDFVCPFDLILAPGQTALIPTGIRVRIDAGWMLALFPRSGLGFKYRLQLDNTVGIIDSDYYFAANEGHIMAKLTNDSHSHKTLCLRAGERFMQGVLLPYGVTVDDSALNLRTGGFGSTGK